MAPIKTPELKTTLKNKLSKSDPFTFKRFDLNRPLFIGTIILPIAAWPANQISIFLIPLGISLLRPRRCAAKSVTGRLMQIAHFDCFEFSVRHKHQVHPCAKNSYHHATQCHNFHILIIMGVIALETAWEILYQLSYCKHGRYYREHYIK
jgi:hypothetical protein